VKKRETFLQAQQQGGKPKPTASAGQNAELISLAKIDQGSERMLRGFFKAFNDQVRTNISFISTRRN
jgi:hypothetical protein